MAVTGATWERPLNGTLCKCLKKQTYFSGRGEGQPGMGPVLGAKAPESHRRMVTKTPATGRITGSA